MFSALHVPGVASAREPGDINQPMRAGGVNGSHALGGQRIESASYAACSEGNMPYSVENRHGAAAAEKVASSRHRPSAAYHRSGQIIEIDLPGESS